MTAFLRGLLFVARILLGMFVLGQLTFLLVANFAVLAQHFQSKYKDTPAAQKWGPDWAKEKDAAHKSIDKAAKVTTRYGESLHQSQNWSLFAPNTWEDIPFVYVEFRWDDGRGGQARPPVFPPPVNEPEDVYSYFRLGKFRVRRYEGNIEVPLYRSANQTREDVVDAWKAKIESKVHEEWQGMRAYLRYRWQVYLRQQGEDLPEPTAYILHARLYRVPPPPGPDPWDWGAPDESPVMRWRPGHVPETGCLPIEVYNPVNERFDGLPR